MTSSTNVNCRRHRYVCEPKALTGSTKTVSSQVFHPGCGTHGQTKLPVYRAGAKSSVSLQSNTVNPAFRLMEAGSTARCAQGMSGRGRWKKQKPFCNGADKGDIISRPRKRADSNWSLVTRKLVETSQEEMTNEHRAICVCILRQDDSLGTDRLEERRVGKEGRSRWSPY